jgi:hypothetical protein
MKRVLLIVALLLFMSLNWILPMLAAVVIHSVLRFVRAISRIPADVDRTILNSTGTRERYTQGW